MTTSDNSRNSRYANSRYADDSEGKAAALPAASMREEMAAAFRPIIRGFLIPSAIYYGLITLFHFIGQDSEHFRALGVLSFVTSVISLYFHQKWLVRDGGYLRLEITNLVMNLLIYLNTVSALLMDFVPAKLVYFVLATLLFATSGISVRVILFSSVLSVGTMLWFAGRGGPDVFLSYALIGLAGTFAALGMALLMRDAILRSVRARVVADRLRERAEQQADFDALTGLPNRRHFFSVLESHMSGPAHSGTPVHVGIIDLDGFKPVNDLHGHAIGDELLSEVGRRIHLACPSGYVVARLGGDEFAVAIPRTLTLDGLHSLGRDICDALRKPFVISGIGVSISGSIGFAHYPTNGETVRQIYERADHALACAKRDNRGGVVIFSADHEAEMNDLGRIDQTLRGSDLVRELFVLFQPQYDLMRERIVGFEALARWESEKLGNVSPGLFIAAAERSGLIERMTSILLKKSLDAAVQWPEALRLSFNLSAVDLVSPRSIANIARIVRESGIAPGRLTFEITETSMTTDFERARVSLGVLAGMGCHIALDDFGSGYSSFAYIHRFPLHRIKMDRCFVAGLKEDEAVSRNIIRAIADLAANLGVECLAEGVETEAELRAVQAAGIRYVQGYFYGRPMAQADIAERLAAQQNAGPLQEAAS
ncbi:EAL domain-containing protein [Rhizobium cremeum]|uniref:putative bifunctional diguanylate cyclase/phosphodiesterase n=1 Tax=Rhizobium cremeum TaxID=2813827 RepID=UPI000DDC57B8